MVPCWMFPLALACGNTLHARSRASAIRRRACSWPSCSSRPACPTACSTSCRATRSPSMRCSTHPDVKALSFVGSTPIAQYIYETGARHGKRVQALGGAKNHMVVMPDADLEQTVDALIGSAYGSAGERCMAISAAVLVGDVGDKIVPEAGRAREDAEDQERHGARRRDGPGDHRRRPGAHRGLHRARREGRRQAGGRWPRLQGARATTEASSPAARLFDHVTPAMRIYQRGDLRPGARLRAREGLRRRRCSSSTTTSSATACRASPATATWRASSRAACRWAWSASTCRSRCRWPGTASAAGSEPVRRHARLWRRGCASTPSKERDAALARSNAARARSSRCRQRRPEQRAAATAAALVPMAQVRCEVGELVSLGSQSTASAATCRCSAARCAGPEIERPHRRRRRRLAGQPRRRRARHRGALRASAPTTARLIEVQSDGMRHGPRRRDGAPGARRGGRGRDEYFFRTLMRFQAVRRRGSI